MSQDDEVSNIIRDLTYMAMTGTKPTNEEWSDMHRRIVKLPRTDRRLLYRDKAYVPLEEVVDWQQACPLDERIKDVGTNSEEDIRIAFEINKRLAIWGGQPDTIECDALLISPLAVLSDEDDVFKRYATKSGSFDIKGVCKHPANYIYIPQRKHIDEDTVIEFLTLATQSGCRSLSLTVLPGENVSAPLKRTSSERTVIDFLFSQSIGGMFGAVVGSVGTFSGRSDNVMLKVKRWLEQNYNLVDKVILCPGKDNHLKEMMPRHFPVYVVTIPDEMPPHPNEELHSSSLPLLTGAPGESFLQPVQDASPESDTSPITDDEVIYRLQQNVTGVDVIIASEPESDKSENSSEPDVHVITVRPQSSSSKNDGKVEQQLKGMHSLRGDIDQWQMLSKKKVVCSSKKCASHSLPMRDTPTDQTYKKALAKAWVRLVEEMHSDELLDRIIEKELLSQTAIQDLQDERNTSAKNRAILKKVCTSGPEKYEVFKECLTLIKQEHLVKLLQTYEKVSDSKAQDEGDTSATP